MNLAYRKSFKYVLGSIPPQLVETRESFPVGLGKAEISNVRRSANYLAAFLLRNSLLMIL